MDISYNRQLTNQEISFGGPTRWHLNCNYDSFKGKKVWWTNKVISTRLSVLLLHIPSTIQNTMAKSEKKFLQKLYCSNVLYIKFLFQKSQIQ